MQKYFVGAAAVAAIVVAFVAGSFIEIDNGSVSLKAQDGPMEQIGEDIDNAVND